MKRFLAILAVSALVLTAAGCASEELETDEINIYYVNGTGDGLIYRSLDYYAESFTESVQIIINEMQSPTLIDDEEGAGSVFQGDIAVAAFEYDSDSMRLNLDLSGGYDSLENTQKLLLTAGVTLTFEQFAQVSDVYVTIGGEALLDSNGEDVGALSADDFVIHTGNEINIYTSKEMVLYFLNETGDGLASETRIVYYNSNLPVEQIVLDELIDGPQEAENQAALPSSLGYLSVTTQDEVCYVNFDENAEQAMETYDCVLALESIVQSIYSVCNVSKVQFSVNGDTSVVFADGTEIDYIYEAN